MVIAMKLYNPLRYRTHQVPALHEDPLAELDFAARMLVGETHLANAQAYSTLAAHWSDTQIDSAVFDSERGSLHVISNSVGATLAISDQESASQVVAMFRLEPTFIRAIRLRGELALVASALGWNYWLRPESVVLDSE